MNQDSEPKEKVVEGMSVPASNQADKEPEIPVVHTARRGVPRVRPRRTIASLLTPDLDMTTPGFIGQSVVNSGLDPAVKTNLLPSELVAPPPNQGSSPRLQPSPSVTPRPPFISPAKPNLPLLPSPGLGPALPNRVPPSKDGGRSLLPPPSTSTSTPRLGSLKSPTPFSTLNSAPTKTASFVNSDLVSTFYSTNPTKQSESTHQMVSFLKDHLSEITADSTATAKEKTISPKKKSPPPSKSNQKSSKQLNLENFKSLDPSSFYHRQNLCEHEPESGVEESLVELDDISTPTSTQSATASVGKFSTVGGGESKPPSKKRKRFLMNQRIKDDKNTMAPIRNSFVANLRELYHYFLGKTALNQISLDKLCNFVPTLTETPRSLSPTCSLRVYQLHAVNWLLHLQANGVGGMLADDMGLGKTLQTIAFLTALNDQGVSGPHLIVSPLSVLSSWSSEFQKWAPHMRAVKFHGGEQERSLIKESLMEAEFDVVLTTFEMLIAELEFFQTKFAWRYLVVDEAHRIKNERTVLAREIRSLGVQYKLLLTGTPLQNNLTELYNLLNFLYPEVFTSPEEFREAFDFTSEEKMTKARLLLSPFVLRRTKSEVESQLPRKREIAVFVPLSEIQTNLYSKLLKSDMGLKVTEGESSTTSQSTSGSGLISLLMELRKCCQHPYLLPGAEPQPYSLGEHLVEASGKLKVLDKLLRKLFKDGNRVLIFSQFTSVLDILSEYCRLRKFKHLRIDGTTPRAQRDVEIKKYNAPGSPFFVFLISTRAGGLGINLVSADTIVIYDSDWNPQMDLQAQDRAHRIGQKKAVNVYRLVTENTCEERILHIAMQKLQMNAAVLEHSTSKAKSQSGGSLSSTELVKILKFGASAILKSKKTMQDTDIEIILSRSESKTETINETIRKQTNGEISESDQLAAGGANSSSENLTSPPPPTTTFDELKSEKIEFPHSENKIEKVEKVEELPSPALQLLLLSETTPKMADEPKNVLENLEVSKEISMTIKSKPTKKNALSKMSLVSTENILFEKRRNRNLAKMSENNESGNSSSEDEDLTKRKENLLAVVTQEIENGGTRKKTRDNREIQKVEELPMVLESEEKSKRVTRGSKRKKSPSPSPPPSKPSRKSKVQKTKETPTDAGIEPSTLESPQLLPPVSPTLPPSMDVEERKPQRATKQMWEHDEECALCKDGGSLLCCASCPKVYHAECLGMSEEEAEDLPSKWSCPWHECTECGRKAAQAGGIIFRCQYCAHHVFCLEHCPIEYQLCASTECRVMEVRGYGTSTAMYFTCVECKKEHPTLLNILQDSLKRPTGQEFFTLPFSDSTPDEPFSIVLWQEHQHHHLSTPSSPSSHSSSDHHHEPETTATVCEDNQNSILKTKSPTTDPPEQHSSDPSTSTCSELAKSSDSPAAENSPQTPEKTDQIKSGVMEIDDFSESDHKSDSMLLSVQPQDEKMDT